ncbi:MAG: hypothetical protein Ct9H300mP1_31410 [Planctomycetaceae bacterium]|nr:MAG: hypothetical protein Ct9H300mP1_31410 [Planctomycetaceae bacterium]
MIADLFGGATFGPGEDPDRETLAEVLSARRETGPKSGVDQRFL